MSSHISPPASGIQQLHEEVKHEESANAGLQADKAGRIIQLDIPERIHRDAYNQEDRQQQHQYMEAHMHCPRLTGIQYVTEIKHLNNLCSFNIRLPLLVQSQAAING